MVTVRSTAAIRKGFVLEHRAGLMLDIGIEKHLVLGVISKEQI